MTYLFVNTKACVLDINAQLLNVSSLHSTAMVSFTTNYSLSWTIVSSRTS